MKLNFLLILIFALAFFSCEKDNEENTGLRKNPPKVPRSVTYDLNDDSIDDIKIEYNDFVWDGDSTSGQMYAGAIETLNECSVLLKRDEYELFLESNDTIEINVNEPFYWEKYTYVDLVTIWNSSANEYLWPNEWKIQSNMIMDFYYVGIKIKSGDNYFVGWIKLKIDDSNGRIKILNKKFTSEEYIVIG